MREKLVAEQCLNVGQDFADGVRANRSWCVRAGSIDAIAGAIERRPARKMIILISGEDEERVAGRDAIICKTREELIEGAVIISKLLDVPRLPRSERSEGERVALVSVRDVGVGDRDTVFLHRSGVRKRCPDHLLRSEEHTSELQSRQYLVCRLLLEKKKSRT